jgi:hypothetical protein
MTHLPDIAAAVVFLLSFAVSRAAQQRKEVERATQKRLDEVLGDVK